MSTRARTIAGVTALAVLVVGLVVLAFIKDSSLRVSTPEPATNWQTNFLVDYTAQAGPLEHEDPDDLIDAAALTCAYLERHDLPQTWRFATDKLELSGDQAATVINVAIRTHCPNVAGAR